MGLHTRCTDAGWRNDFRQYFEEQADRLYPEQKLTLFQKLGKKMSDTIRIMGFMKKDGHIEACLS